MEGINRRVDEDDVLGFRDVEIRYRKVDLK